MNLCNCFFASISWLYSKLLDKMNKINKQKFVWKGPLSLETFPASKISSTSVLGGVGSNSCDMKNKFRVTQTTISQ